MKKVILFSGGIDSTALLFKSLTETPEDEVICLFLDYGQLNASHEWEAIDELDIWLRQNKCYWKGIKNVQLASRKIEWPAKYAKSALLGNESTNYALPMRNPHFILYAAIIALEEGAEEVWIGIHTGDIVYDDCNLQALELLNRALVIATGGQVNLRYPLINYKNKKEAVLKIGKEFTAKTKLLVPWHLTWSCYENQGEPCGSCPACKQRKLLEEVIVCSQ